MPTVLDAATFVTHSRTLPVFDVRTPAEYAHGHLPDAVNLPLFSNDERAEVGTLYKQEGRQAAILRGLDLAGPRLRTLVDQVIAVAGNADPVLVHCWRGGMRSGSVAWLLETYGFQTYTLRGGYKAFRTYALEALEAPRPVCIVGGLTGSGKTDVLHALAEAGEQVIDLERLARHKGSVFGRFGEPEQPTQQQFENELALEWTALDADRPVWIEDESRRIGQISIPDALWRQMRAAPVYVIDVPQAYRIQQLVACYGAFPTEELAEAFRQIERRLGGNRTAEALAALEAGDLHAACALSLHYYDRAYQYALERRPSHQIHHVACEDAPTPQAFARALREKGEGRSIGTALS